MQSIYWTGRLLSRALWNGLTAPPPPPPSPPHSRATNASCPNAEASKHCGASFVSAVCGFPKDFKHGGRIQKGQFGDDAWFAAKFKAVEVIGVADGVGGWRHYGIDPGEFSSFLMKTCERLVSMGRFAPTEPASLLARSYCELLENKQPILGSSTACVVVLNKETRSVYTANIGDSGFVVVRKGRVVHRSSEQQHYFNTPFQLSLPPPGHSGLVLSDSPESADTSSFGVEDGDVILLATDGVFDNVPDQLLVTEMQKIEGERDPTKIQGVANSIAWMARSLAFDGAFMSPFAQSARQNGIDAIGGKPDDITVLLATVAM